MNSPRRPRPLFLCLVAALGTGSVSGCSPSEPPAAEAFRKLGARNLQIQDGKLIEINLAQAPITDADLAALADQKDVLHLDLGLCTKITDAGLDHVANLTQLETLTVNSNPNITDAGIAKLGGLKRLRVLDIGQSKITDKSLEAVAQLPALEKLAIAFTPAIGDEGIAHLDRLTKLNEIWLPGTGVTQEGVKRLREAHPGINVHGASEEDEEEN